MDERESLNHTQWECKFRVVFILKYRRKALYKKLRRYRREVFRRLGSKRRIGLKKAPDG